MDLTFIPLRERYIRVSVFDDGEPPSISEIIGIAPDQSAKGFPDDCPSSNMVLVYFCPVSGCFGTGKQDRHGEFHRSRVFRATWPQEEDSPRTAEYVAESLASLRKDNPFDEEDDDPDAASPPAPAAE